jgi:hypothetical protein
MGLLLAPEARFMAAGRPPDGYTDIRCMSHDPAHGIRFSIELTPLASALDGRQEDLGDGGAFNAF